MKRKHIIEFVLTALLSFGAIVPSIFKKGEIVDVGDDPIEYNTSPKVVRFDEPHFKNVVRASSDEDDDESVGPVSEVKIHYVNDDKKCASRAFYIWATGIDGVEYSDEHNGADILEYAADGSSMTITININKDNPDPRFKDFVGLNSIFYIIKYKMVSESNLNWGGQSDDVELVFAEFPPENEKVEVWSTPAAGGGMAQFATEEETKVDGVKMAKFSDWKTIRCTTTDDAMSVKWNLYAFDENYYRVKLKKREAIKKNYLVLSGTNDVTETNKEFNIEFPYTAKINMVYSLESKEVSATSNLAKTVFVSYEQLYDTPKFEKYYCYDGDDLGMTYTPEFTTFKVWSPISANMSLLLYSPGNDSPAIYGGNDKSERGWHMSYSTGGVWELTVLGNLKGYYYNFQVDNVGGTSTTVDPYVTAVGCSGVRGLVYDKSETNPEHWNDVPLVWDGAANYDISTPQELSIYEVHVRDFTGDESWISSNTENPTKRGTYNAFVEEGTTYTGEDVDGNSQTVKTGFDHLKELGINTVQLMPMFDADNDESDRIVDSERGIRAIDKYNWGYNPQNYNAVEGSYSSNPHDGLARIKEFKNLVYKLATCESHIRVTMDVVYNHVSSVSASPFTKLMPRYYFRYAKEGDQKVIEGKIPVGELYDGSGCHNEVRSEAKMMSKFIVDSTYMWAKEYKVKGFRFDLMGLLDYRTMNKVKDKLSTLDRDIYVYGEGWTSIDGYNGSWYETGSTSTHEVYKYCNNFNSLTGDDNTAKCYLGCFNDTGRNAVKGSNDEYGASTVVPQSGYMQKDSFWEEPNAVADMVWGIHRNRSNYAKQTVNYVSCHDNWTIVDHMWQTLGDGTKGARTNTIVHASIASHALVFASNGVAFMLGGEELYRTKQVSDKMIEDGDVTAATYTDLYHRHVSHNSYNSPLAVNSFKWGNKIKVSISGDEEDWVNGSTFNDAWKTLVGLHKHVRFDAPAKRGDVWPSGTTHEGAHYENLCWLNGTALGIQFDEMFIYVFNKNGGALSYDYTPVGGKYFEYGASSDGSNITAGGPGVIVQWRA